MEEEFQKIKKILQAPMTLQVFKRGWNTILYTDYSSKGVGFALTQENPQKPEERVLIYCDSASLTPKQKKLPAIYEIIKNITESCDICKNSIQDPQPIQTLSQKDK